MNEKTLAFIWQNRLFDPAGLHTTQGENIQVVKTGYVNTMSGPDITNAQIRIGNILWNGNVEFHTKSSHWVRHGHHLDHAYDNIILHVVFEDDAPLADHQGNKVPTLIIKYDQSIDERCQQLIKQQDTRLCPAGILELNTFNSLTFTTRLTIERLQQKSELIRAALEATQGDWMQTFWQYLARAFGFGKNSTPFELMAKSLPYNLIIKNSDSFVIILSLLYGQAGFLLSGKYKGNDRELLLQEYQFQQAKYNLSPIDHSIWKYSGTRPQNSAFVRVRQLASLVATNTPLFDRMLSYNTVEQMESLFQIKNNNEIPPLGTDAKQLLIINLVCPFLTCYAQYTGNTELATLAVDLLEKLPPEKNSLVATKSKAGLAIHSAYDSQAIIQLDTAYCKPRRCIECQIGRHYIAGKTK
ncbi:MAG: DUF2851 family protein [Bacteroidales bacterium]|nr:DUF2851 family protein [Bacteroidales bacterium]